MPPPPRSTVSWLARTGAPIIGAPNVHRSTFIGRADFSMRGGCTSTTDPRCYAGFRRGSRAGVADFVTATRSTRPVALGAARSGAPLDWMARGARAPKRFGAADGSAATADAIDLLAKLGLSDGSDYRIVGDQVQIATTGGAKIIAYANLMLGIRDAALNVRSSVQNAESALANSGYDYAERKALLAAMEQRIANTNKILAGLKATFPGIVTSQALPKLGSLGLDPITWVVIAVVAVVALVGGGVAIGHYMAKSPAQAKAEAANEFRSYFSRLRDEITANDHLPEKEPGKWKGDIRALQVVLLTRLSEAEDITKTMPVPGSEWSWLTTFAWSAVAAVSIWGVVKLWRKGLIQKGYGKVKEARGALDFSGPILAEGWSGIKTDSEEALRQAKRERAYASAHPPAAAAPTPMTTARAILIKTKKPAKKKTKKA